jgi:polyadenylate-binding protein
MGAKGYGFVNFETPDSAAAAIKALNGKELQDGRQLYVGRAQKKSERDAEMRQQAEQRKLERISKYQGVNLYVKNLEDSINDDKLREEFCALRHHHVVPRHV